MGILTSALSNSKDLVVVTKGCPTTTSIQIAETFMRRHDNVIASIRKLECSDSFRLLNFKESSYLNEQGKPQPMFILTEKGFSILAMGFTGKRAAEWRERYIDAFEAMKTALMQRQSAEWQAARAAGKIVRCSETDAIAEFIKYAEAQGSKNAGFFYINLTRLAYKALGFQDFHRPARDMLNPQQAAALTLIESAITTTLCSGIQSGAHYRDIYSTAKARAYDLASALVPNIPCLVA